MLRDILFGVGAWLGATALFVGVPMWRAMKREPLRRHALFFPRRTGVLPYVGMEVWVEWWKAFHGIAGSGRGRVVELREDVVIVEVDGRAIELRPRRFGKQAASGPAVVDGIEVSAVVVTSAPS